MTRPDVAFAAGKLSASLQNPSSKHDLAINRAISYLYHTRFCPLELVGKDEKAGAFEASNHAVYAVGPVTRKSTQGFLFHLFGGAIDWKSVKQKTVGTTSTEAELLALSKAGRAIY